MRKSTWVLLMIICLIVIACAPDESSGFVRRALKKVEKTVRKVVFKPVKKVFKEVVEKTSLVCVKSRRTQEGS